MKSKNFYTSLIIVLLLGISNLKAQVVINELSCSNLSQFVDNHSDYGDWFELYNTSATAINLGGYYLSDDSASNMKWQIPAGVTINANGFLKFWASGRDEVVGTSYHTNFKLTQTKNNKEDLTLSDPSGVIVNQVKLSVETQTGHSYGRTTNGAATWSIFTTPTPGASNNTSTPYLRYAAKPDFSVPAGFYPSTQSVVVYTAEPNSSIHYTIDGNIPTITSILSTGVVNITTTKVLKAITYSTDPQILPSFIRFDTYFINVSHTVPVVSITGTNLTQLANGSGTLTPFGSFEYFDTSQVRKAKTYGEFNRHGQDSWANSQRSLDFVSRDEMGYNYAIKEQLFKVTPRDEYQRVILRAAGDDNYPADHHAANAGSAHVRDAYVMNLSHSGGLDLDVRLGAKCVVYLNGNYWGVYDLRDNPDDHDNTKYYYGQDKYHLQFIETWGNTWAQYGGAQTLTDWTNFRNFIMSNNMTDSANFKYVSDRLDFLSLIDYVAVNSFVVCSDWLNWNTGWWRGTDSTGTHLKWGYILWDNDAVFDFYINYTGIPSTAYNAPPCNPLGLTGSSDPEGHITMLNKLRTNPEFDQLFINRQLDLWNTTYSCDYMLPYLDSTVAVIDPEMTQHAARWAGTYTEWQTNVATLRNFIVNRCAYLASGFTGCYGLTGPFNVVVVTDPPNVGTVKFNTLDIKQFPWTGQYYSGVNTTLEAKPDTLYSFVNWSSGSQTFSPNNTSINSTVNLTGTDTIVAHFTLSNGINEHSGLVPSLEVYPTAFNIETTVSFNLPATVPVSLKVYSVIGNEITSLENSESVMPAGRHSYKLNFEKTQLPAGMYIVELVAGGYKKTEKLVYTPR
ncbi:MAG: CotH kinase family protein [Bacteroidia bacterium]